MTKQAEVTEQTRANLLEAFWSLYTEKRIDQITVKEIAAKAGYNRGTFYEYFGDVYQCLEQIELMVLPRFEELPPIPENQAASAELFESFITLYQEKLKYYDVLLGERGDPSFHRKFIDGVKATIRNAGQFGKIDPVELDFMLEYLVSGMIGIMRYYFRNKPKGSQTEIMALIYRLMNGDILQQIRQFML